MFNQAQSKHGATIPLEQAQLLLPDKATYYAGLKRNEYVLPKIKSGICTVQWMIKVRSGEVWCPKETDVKNFKQCTQPPKKEELLKEVLTVAAAKRRRTGMDAKHVPDKAWLLVVLSVLEPNHRFFKKDYMPEKEVHEEVKLDNADGFFDDLPLGPRKKMMGRVL